MGILGLALSAMAIDMLVLQSEPQSAAAGETLAQGPPAGLAETQDAGPSLAEVLETLATAEPARDEMFSVPDAWQPREVEEGPVELRVSMPVLRLTNTLADVAQINGRAIRAGEFVDRERAIRLVRIENVGMQIDGVGRAPSAIIEFSGVLYRLRAGTDEPEAISAADRNDSED